MYETTKQVKYVLNLLNNKSDGYFIDIGANDGVNISNSYATGSVTGNFATGGFAGWAVVADFINCHASGVVTGTCAKMAR